MAHEIQTAWVGIDVAIAKGKPLPVSVCVMRSGLLTPLPLSEVDFAHPIGGGNPSMLDGEAARELALTTAQYLHAIEQNFNISIRAIAIDAPRRPAITERRACEKALDALGISCYPTPTETQFANIINSGQRHLASGGKVSRLPNGFQLWMLAGFQLFRILSERWECLEVYPQAIIRQLGYAGRHKSKADGYQEQLCRISQATSWNSSLLESTLVRTVRGAKHDKLDAYMSAWIASLYPDSVVACGDPPADVIWLPEPQEAIVRERVSAVEDSSNIDDSVSDDFRSGSTKTTTVGYTNRNGQICCGTRGLAGTDYGQVSYKLQCSHCHNDYGANGTDIFQRKCPHCQGGARGLAF